MHNTSFNLKNPVLFLKSPSPSSPRCRFRHCLAASIAMSLMASSSTSASAITRALSVGQPLTTRYDYEAPVWAQGKFQHGPKSRLHMANLPTPVYQWTMRNGLDDDDVTPKSEFWQRLKELDITLYIKRDDMTGGCETGGNKVRKLEFLLADALEQGCRKVITIGGEQSNHCRATASACRMLGLEPHLILRTKRANEIQEAAVEESAEEGLGYTGNILFDRLVGSTIYTCTPGEYGRLGSRQLVSRVCAHLEEQSSSQKVYPIPVGGSNGIGTWGYLDGVDELLSQWKSITSETSLDHVLFACGSGGTAAGIALGMALAFEEGGTQAPPKVHAMGVCDSPDYFYDHVAAIAQEMGFQVPQDGMTMEEYFRRHMIAHQAKGLGYAANTPEELEFISTLAFESGVVLDPVYSGKALYHFFKNELKGDGAEKYRGSNILFWHTGGALGMYEKASSLLQTMDQISPVKRLDVYGKDGDDKTVDISNATQ